MNESLQQDIAMLRQQLARGEEFRVKQEIVITGANDLIASMNANHKKQMNDKEKNH